MSVGIDLAGQTAWVTGGASGLGAATVSALSAAGAKVVALDLAFSTAADDIEDAAIMRVALDLRDRRAVDSTAAALIARGVTPDILVNNAGITRDGVVWRLSDEDWDGVLEVNLGGAFRMTRACAPSMRQRRRGAIVNIASINAMRGKFGQSNYAASKAGIIGLTKSTARELAREGIRVNAIAPGFIETAMTAALPAEVRAAAAREALLGRLGRPEDIAHAVLFLASPLASHITGQVLVVDGGQTL
jgi:NAD(P)-dependent dehydrogenase (short-subunit alcohol dehydrogenase family)